MPAPIRIKARRLFVNLHVDADLAQRGGDGQAADASADDGNGKSFHGNLPYSIIFRMLSYLTSHGLCSAGVPPAFL